VKAYFETVMAGDDEEVFEQLASFMVSDSPKSKVQGRKASRQ